MGISICFFVSFNKAKQFVIIFKKFVKDMPECDWIDFKRALKHDNTYNNSLSSRVVCVLIYYDLAQRFTEYDYNHLQRFLNALKKVGSNTYISLFCSSQKSIEYANFFNELHVQMKQSLIYKLDALSKLLSFKIMDNFIGMTTLTE